MEFKDITAQLFERSNAMQTFWSYYITIALALIAFFGTTQRSKTLAAIFTIAFVGVAMVNLDGMKNIAHQRLALQDLVAAAKAPSAAAVFAKPVSAKVVDAYISSVHPPSVCGVVVAHLFCDAVVIAAIWVLTPRGTKVP